MDNWAKMEKWFSRFGTLKKVDAALDQQAVYFEVEKCLEDTIKKVQNCIGYRLNKKISSMNWWQQISVNLHIVIRMLFCAKTRLDIIDAIQN